MTEIIMLRTDDIAARDGVLCFVIRPDPDNDKRLKSPSATRIVPVHPTLLGLGFREFVDRQRAGGHGRLFEASTKTFRSWFSRHLDRLGVKTPRTSFHSTRHSFRDAIGATGAPRDVVLSLGGWSSGHVADIYGSGPSPKMLFECISKIEFPGLDLDHPGLE